MEILETKLPGVLRVLPRILGDDRGWFAETFQARRFAEAGIPTAFAQENQSFSRKGVLRGLHFQIVEPQGKLVRAVGGEIWDVAVDLRRGSPHFGEWAGFHLSAQTCESLWIPEGFGHGFVVLSEIAEVAYKATRFYHPQGERSVRWDDPTLAIEWPLDGVGTPIVSGKDAAAPLLEDAELPES